MNKVHSETKQEPTGSLQTAPASCFLCLWWMVAVVAVTLTFSLTILSSSLAIRYLRVITRLQRMNMRFDNPVSSTRLIGNLLAIPETEYRLTRLLRTHEVWSKLSLKSYIALVFSTVFAGLGYSIGLGAPFWFPLALLLPFASAPLVSKSWTTE